MIDPDALWLWLNLAEGVGPKTANAVWAALSARGLHLEDFFDLGETEWANDFGLNARAARGLAAQKERMDEITSHLESLHASGAWLMTIDRPGYPATMKTALGQSAPALLYAKGNRDLLAMPAVAVVGARDASPRGLALARFIGSDLGQRGFAVVSGGARGTDAAAHLGALEAGGATIVVLSCGILRYRAPSGLRGMADSQSALFLSEFPPQQTWAAGAAMARNRIVCGLASGLVVVESKESGGTLNAAETARKMSKPVFVVRFDEYDTHSAGNRLLLKQGCRALKAQLDPSDETWRADLTPVIAAAERTPSSRPDSVQGDLFS